MKKCRLVVAFLSILLFIVFFPVSGINRMAFGEKELAVSPIDKSLNGTTSPKSAHSHKNLHGRDAPLWHKGQAQALNKPPIIKKIDDGLFELGNLVINKAEGFVVVNGKVNMQKGLVEYLACSSRGKLHESVLNLDVDPYYLQIALLLIDLEPGGQARVGQGESKVIKGDPVEIRVRWKGKDKRLVEHRAEKLIINQSEKKTMKETDWIFTGSQVVGGRFMARVEHSIAATYHDPFALLDHPLISGSDDTIFYANSDLLPPVGTRVDFIVKSKKNNIKPID